MKSTIVVPTIREESIKKFLKEWKDEFKGHRVIVVEDNPKKSFNIKNVEHYSWDDIDKDLGKDSWIIPRRTAAIRNYGFLKALEKETDMIVSLDDDCYPSGGGFLKQHYSNLYEKTYINRWMSTGKNNEQVRGVPYKNRFKRIEVAISHGTWLNNPDWDAIQQLSGAKDFEPFVGVIDRGQYFPLCSMNFAFRPRYTYILYQVLSGENSLGHKYDYNRFDDIWGGVFAKRVLDHVGKHVVTGTPPVFHMRASNPMTNLVKEAPGIPMNENLWEIVDDVDLSSDKVDYCYREIAEKLSTEVKGEYWDKLTKAMKLWVDYVQKGFVKKS